MDIRDSSRCLPMAQKGGKLDSALCPAEQHSPDISQAHKTPMLNRVEGEQDRATETDKERKIYIWLIYVKKIKGEIRDR